MGFNSPFNSSGGSQILTDIEVDSGTLSIDETNNRVGIGDTAPGTKLQVKDTAPYMTLQNSTSENSDGGCESKIIGEDHANVTLGQIEISHSGSSDDTKGQLILSTHTGSALTAALTIDEGQDATFAGDVLVANNGSIQANGTGTLTLGNTNSGVIKVGGDGGTSTVLSTTNHLSLQTARDDDDVFIKAGDSVATCVFVEGSSGNVGIGSATLAATQLTVEGTISLKEQADADADTAAYGQIWVNTATPCELYFTDDAGTDTQLGTGGGGADANDLDHILHQQVFS